MTPLVLNKHYCGDPPHAVYIGRPSDWGNPYAIGRDGDRGAVIAKHEAWLRGQRPLLHRLDELRGKHLICFCAPAACHGDLLLRLANASREERIAWWRGPASGIEACKAETNVSVHESPVAAGQTPELPAAALRAHLDQGGRDDA